MIYTYVTKICIYFSVFVSSVLHSLSSWPMYHHVWKDSDSTNNKEALHSTNRPSLFLSKSPLQYIISYNIYVISWDFSITRQIIRWKWMVSLPSIGVLQVGGLGSILDIKSDSISTSKLMEICCPNRVVNQQHFVERNLIVFCLRGMWHSKRGDFENHKKNFLAG